MAVEGAADIGAIGSASSAAAAAAVGFGASDTEAVGVGRSGVNFVAVAPGYATVPIAVAVAHDRAWMWASVGVSCGAVWIGSWRDS